MPPSEQSKIKQISQIEAFKKQIQDKDEKLQRAETASLVQKNGILTEERQKLNERIMFIKMKMVVNTLNHKDLRAEKGKSIESFIETQESFQEKIASLEQKNGIQTEEIQQLNEPNMSIKEDENRKKEIRANLNEWEQSKIKQISVLKENHESIERQMQHKVDHLQNTIRCLKQQFEAKLNEQRVAIKQIQRDNNELQRSNQSLEQQIEEDRKGVSSLMNVQSQINGVHKSTVDMIKSLHSNHQKGRPRPYR